MRTATTPDVQAGRPSVAVALSSAGVANVRRLVVLGGEPLDLTLGCAVDLPAHQRGAHMSRFEEAVDAALRAEPPVEALAARIARLVRDGQDAARAHVTLEARRADASGAELHTVLGAATATAAGARHAVGVRVQGITACPCAQATIAERARERLADRGLSEEEVDDLLEVVPVATHNQRGLAALRLAADGATALAPAPLLAIAREAMSAEIAERLKRSDEADVVERAHRRPRFVEDCVREMLAGVAALPVLGDDVIVDAHQRNLETIHRHDVVAARTVALGALRAELDGADAAPAPPSLDAWLAASA